MPSRDKAFLVGNISLENPKTTFLGGIFELRSAQLFPTRSQSPDSGMEGKYWKGWGGVVMEGGAITF